MAKKDLNDYIKRSHLKAVEKFNTELEAFAMETGDAEATLYENPFTSFTLSHVHVMEFRIQRRSITKKRRIDYGKV